MDTLIPFLDLFGTAVFAISGGLAAGEKRMDLFGVVVLAVVTAVGGGTLRDLVLGDTPVFWVQQPVYLSVAALSAVATFILVRFLHPPRRLLAVADAVGLAAFTVIGTEKALALGVGAGVAMVMGVMTGAVGGMLRDVLAGEVPLILRREIYATASLSGAVALVLVTLLGGGRLWAIGLCLVVTLGLRLSALHWNLGLPVSIGRR